MESVLLEPVTYYKQQKGKDIRRILGEIIGKLLQVNTEDTNLINSLIHNIHNASLVIDDIQDDSTLRRNEQCAHIKYGIPLSINAGYLEIFKTLHIIHTAFKKETVSKIIEYLKYIHIGQGMDIYYTQNKFIPSLEDYTTMMVYKTGYAFIIQFELLIDKSKNVILKQKHELVKTLLIKLSIFYQIRDDYINLTDPEYWGKKGFCQDFDEEKISYLITYFKTMNETNVIEMMKNKTTKGKIQILTLFNETGLFDIIYNKLTELKGEILSEMKLDYIFDHLPFHKFDINDVEKI